MHRRRFLNLSARAALAGLLAPRIGFAAPGGAPADRYLVTLFLRGGCDGLNTLVPYTERNYYDQRPTIAIAEPAPQDPLSAIDLDGRFGLHPSLGPLKSLYDQGQVAFLPAVHVPTTEYSHFELQDMVDSGCNVPLPDGWLARYAKLPEHPGSSPCTVSRTNRLTRYSAWKRRRSTSAWRR